jgi:hypothetical protein
MIVNIVQLYQMTLILSATPMILHKIQIKTLIHLIDIYTVLLNSFSKTLILLLCTCIFWGVCSDAHPTRVMPIKEYSQSETILVNKDRFLYFADKYAVMTL